MDILEKYGNVINRSALPRVMKKFLGIPYLEKGRCIENGVDCVGLPILVAHEFGVEINESLNYPNSPDGMLYEKLELYLDRIDRKDIQVGDIVLFSSNDEPCHVAMVTEVQPLYVLQALNRHQYKVVETRVFGEFEKNICAYFRFKNILED